MNILLQTLLLFGGINLIAARYVHWSNAPFMPLEDDVYRSLISQYKHDVRDYSDFHELFHDFDTEEDLSKQPVISQASDELDGKQYKDLESLLSAVLAANYDDNVDERKIADVSKEITNEMDADDKSDNDDDKNDNDDNDDNNDDTKEDKEKDLESLLREVLGTNDYYASKEITNEKNADDKSDTDDDKNDNDDNDDNNDDNDNDDNNTKEDKEEEDEIIDNSNEEISVKPLVTVDELLLLLDKSSEESNETLTVNQGDNGDNDIADKETISVPLEKHELSEKEIKELTAFLVTLSTMEDLLKVAENIEDEDNSQNAEELFEQKLKEVDNFMGLFINTLDSILEETTDDGKAAEKSENDDDDNDNDDKDDNDKDDNNDNDDKDNDDDDDKKEKAASSEDNNNKDASVSVEFHSINTQTNAQNMDINKYNLIERSIRTNHYDFKPTSSPYTPEPYSPSANPNAAIIHEYIEEREQLDALQENLFANKLNMDKDFYHIIANEDGDDKDVQKFGNDIAVMRENIFKMKQIIEAMQDIKSKLYFHQLIKSALKDAQLN